MRRLAGIEQGDDCIPPFSDCFAFTHRAVDEPTTLNFRHLLERHEFIKALFAEVNGQLAENGITLRSGTIMDAITVNAPSSTKNKARTRAPEMSSTKNGNRAWSRGDRARREALTPS